MIRGLELAVQIGMRWDNEVEGGKLGYVYLKTDSEYAVCGMTEWMAKWEMNGYLTSNE